MRPPDSLCLSLVNHRHDLLLGLRRGRRIAAEVFSSWRSAEPAGDHSTPAEPLARAGLVAAAQQRYAFTALGDQLLRDAFGARLDGSLGETYRRAGLAATLRRVDGLGDGPLSQRRVEQLAGEAAQQVMSELRHASSFALHEQALGDLAGRLTSLTEQVAAEAALNAERLRQLRLNNERGTRAQTVTPPDGAAAANAPALRWCEWRPWRRPAPAPQASRPAPAHNQRGGDETLLWEAAVRQAVLEAEVRLLAAINGALADELATDAQSLALIGEGERAALAAAQASEGVRDWGLAASEILLNGPDLTEAAIRQLWPDRRNLLTLIFSKYAEEDGAGATLTDEVVTAETIEGINDVVDEIVSRAMSGWTITDALAALSASDSDLLRRIQDAFRQLTDRDFLATGYDHILPRVAYVVITCAPSKLAAANSFFTGWLENLSRTLDVEFGVEADPLLKDCLCCYLENFSLPLSALRVCEDYVEGGGGQDPAASPLFTPHPDILPGVIHSAPLPVGAEEESEGRHIAG